MSTTSESSSDSEYSNVPWKQADDFSYPPGHSPTITPPSSQTIPSPNSPQQPTPHTIQETTTDFTLPMGIRPREPGVFVPESITTPAPYRKRGRKSRRSKFHGNQYTTKDGISRSEVSSTPKPDSSPHNSFTKPEPKRFKFTLPRRGYVSQFSKPFPFRKQAVQFERSTGVKSTKASIPSGMRILDIGILAEAMSKLRCQLCSKSLALYESEFLYGWQTTFFIKCSHCHQLFSEFPSSKPMGLPEPSKFVNVQLPKQGLNEVTMRSILFVHCSGSSWRDLHKFASIFEMPPPLEHMPSSYLNKIEDTVKMAAEVSMQAAAEELHISLDSVPSPIPGCINTAVSFDSSWKTRGFHSNLGFGSVISASIRKVLDYVLFNRICEKCNRWPVTRQERQPGEYQKWYDAHKVNCMKNFSGSSQSMEPEAAKLMWGRSIEKRKICYSTFIGDGDSKSFQQVSNMNPYPSLPIHKEECLAHVSKRLKKSLCKIKANTKKHSYVQFKLPESKSEFISSNYSKIVLLNKGKSAAHLAQELNTFLFHISGDHSNCPEDDSKCKRTNFTSNDIDKVREVFLTYGTEEFCSHLTLGMTQNANESLHNAIWNFCPKAKYLSPQSVRISTAIAVTVFNEGELSMYGIMHDLKLNPSHISFDSLCRREMTRQLKRNYIKKSNVDRHNRRRTRVKQLREQSLLKREGGSSYQSSNFGAETFQTPPKKPAFIRGLAPVRKRVARLPPARGKCVKRRHISDDDSTSTTSSISILSDSSSDASSEGVCDVCELRQPPSERHRFSKWPEVTWVGCESCDRWFHQCCTELSKDVDVSSIEFRCFHCS